MAEKIVELAKGDDCFTRIYSFKSDILREADRLSSGDKLMLDLKESHEIAYFFLIFIFEIEDQLRTKGLTLCLRNCESKLKATGTTGISKGMIERFKGLCEKKTPWN